MRGDAILKALDAIQRFDELLEKVIKLCERAGVDCEDLKALREEQL